MTTAPSATVLTPSQLLAHWQGHRALTRRVIEAFPDDKAFTTFSLAGLRPFAEMVTELLDIAVPIARVVGSDEWVSAEAKTPTTKAEALDLWDADTAELGRLWAQIPPHRFQEVTVTFGQFEGTCYWQILYAVDNEVHHRGKGYLYLRALGVEPPPFWERGEEPA